MTPIDKTTDEPLPMLPPRNVDSHKGDFGRVLLIGGSRGMAGSISLSGMAALRGGAGLVQLAVPASCVSTVAAFEPSYMTLPLTEDDEGRIDFSAASQLEAAWPRATVVGCGPGLGHSETLADLVARLYATIDKPMVVDADGVNALAQRHLALGAPGGPRVLTPHPVEFRRLIGHENDPAAAPMGREELEARARELAIHLHAVIVLKGHRTLITDGQRSAHNTTGNPGMATGGTGDVLTGLITALLAQGLSPFDAARLGAHLHGRAGDQAAAEVGEVSLIASDLIDFLPAAFQELPQIADKAARRAPPRAKSR